MLPPLNPPPPEHERYFRYNVGQQRYWWQEYNKTRLRRGLNLFIDSVPMDDVSTSTGASAAKRTSDGGEASAAKKKKLPGTANEEASDPDTGNPNLENAVIHRAIHQSSGQRLVFRKNHSFVSYGIASVQLVLDPTGYQRVGTNLMSVLV
ncbi:Hypothetical protein CINCED_3A003156 [Cinara cedri]|uniref:Uncharacterized protein n=1 Tax=Cinara cedri TaxID=506608 RepID=A0A5E4NIB7_9HEMI|nr:Hypothetical protein CINCED_3A003156 [Cinara cedri]